MAISCDPQALVTATSCYSCLSDVTQMQIQTYLLALIAGVTTDPNALAALARGFQGLDPLPAQQIQVYLLCQIATAAGA